MSTSKNFSTSKIFNQKGNVPFLAIAIIGVVILGGSFLISKNSNNSQKISQTQGQKQNTISPEPSSSIQWEIYKDEQYGYSLKRPAGWVVENMPSENSRLIKVTDPDKTTFVLIEGIAGPSLEKESELEKVMDLLEDKLKKNSNLKIATFTRSNEDNSSGYLATGEETFDNKTVAFEERFMVWKNGRGIRLHSGYAPDSKEINKPVTAEIMSSFTTD